MNEMWRRFRRDKVAVVGALVIIAISIAAVFAPAVTPYDPHEQFFEGLTIEGEIGRASCRERV